MANNFADLFEHSVGAMPDRVAITQDGRRVTYRELEDRANRLAHHLASTGVGCGTHVGFRMHNGIETMQTLIACLTDTAPGLDLADLQAHVRRHLGGYKVPRKVWIADAVTRSPSGKPDHGTD